MRTGLKALWLFEQLGLSINQAAEQIGVRRGTIDNWKSKEDSNPGPKIVRALVTLAREHGHELTMDWFYSDAAPVLPARSGSSWVPPGDPVPNPSISTVRALSSVIKSFGLVLRRAAPDSFYEVSPLVEYAVEEVEALRTGPAIAPSDSIKLESAAAMLRTLVDLPDARS